MEEYNFIVDRIEGRSVVLQNYKKEIIIIDKSNIKKLPKEGDVLIKINKNQYIIDEQLTKERKNYISALAKGMWGE